MSQGDRHPSVVNVEEVAAVSVEHGERYARLRKQLGAASHGKRLGCSWIELPPGKRAWPMHYHCVNEEAIFVLEGEGTLRLGEAQLAVKQGDYIALPAGKEGAHQMINTSLAPLRYLCVSTMEPNEIAVYPDSNKLFVCAGAAPGGAKAQRLLTKVFRAEDEVDYWEGE